MYKTRKQTTVQDENQKQRDFAQTIIEAILLINKSYDCDKYFNNKDINKKN